jgi:hypothetical protein
VKKFYGDGRKQRKSSTQKISKEDPKKHNKKSKKTQKIEIK